MVKSLKSRMAKVPLHKAGVQCPLLEYLNFTEPTWQLILTNQGTALRAGSWAKSHWQWGGETPEHSLWMGKEREAQAMGK